MFPTNRKPAIPDRYIHLEAMIREEGGNDLDIRQAIELLNDPGVRRWMNTATCLCFQMLMQQRLCSPRLATIIYMAPIQ